MAFCNVVAGISNKSAKATIAEMFCKLCSQIRFISESGNTGLHLE